METDDVQIPLTFAGVVKEDVVWTTNDLKLELHEKVGLSIPDVEAQIPQLTDPSLRCGLFCRDIMKGDSGALLLCLASAPRKEFDLILRLTIVDGKITTEEISVKEFREKYDSLRFIEAVGALTRDVIEGPRGALD